MISVGPASFSSSLASTSSGSSIEPVKRKSGARSSKKRQRTNRSNDSRLESRIVPRSAILSRLDSCFRIAFSQFPWGYCTFMKPLEKLSLDLNEYPQFEKKDLVGNYEIEVLDKGFDGSVVQVAFISDEVGYGVFAVTDIKKGTPIGVYAGRYQLNLPDRDQSKSYVYDILEGIDDAESPISSIVRGTFEKAARKRFGADHEKPKEGYELVIDGTEVGNFTRYLNDGAKYANVDTEIVIIDGQLEVLLTANKKIISGEQLLISYGDQYWRALELTTNKKFQPLQPRTYLLDRQEGSPLGAFSIALSSPSILSESGQLVVLTSSESSSSAAIGHLEDDLSPESSLILHHYKRLKELNESPGDISMICLKEAKKLLSPLAERGSEKIAFCYLNLAASRPSVSEQPLWVKEQIKVLSIQRHEMKMVLLQKRDQYLLNNPKKLDVLREFVQLEESLLAGGRGYAATLDLLKDYNQLAHSSSGIVRVLSHFRAAELLMFLSDYDTTMRLSYLSEAKEEIDKLMSLAAVNHVPYLRRLANSYRIECEKKMQEEAPLLLSLDVQEHFSPPFFEASSSIPPKKVSTLVEFIQLSYFKNMQKAAFSKKKIGGKMGNSLARELLENSMPKGVKQTAFYLFDWEAERAKVATIPFRLQRNEMKCELLLLQSQFPSDVSLQSFIRLEKNQKEYDLDALKGEYSLLKKSSLSLIRAFAYFRLGEIAFERENQVETAKYFKQFKDTLASDLTVQLPHTLKLVDAYLHNIPQQPEESV